jgi:hypothetical protein
MEDLIKEHLDKFGVEPKVIGMFWSEPDLLIDGIANAIDKGEPYDEYMMLSAEDRKAYDQGKLFF